MKAYLNGKSCVVLERGIPQWALDEFISVRTPSLSVETTGDLMTFVLTEVEVSHQFASGTYYRVAGSFSRFVDHVHYFSSYSFVEELQMYLTEAGPVSSVSGSWYVCSALEYVYKRRPWAPLPYWVSLEYNIMHKSSMPPLEDDLGRQIDNWHYVASYASEEGVFAVQALISEDFAIPDFEYSQYCRFVKYYVSYDGTCPGVRLQLKYCFLELPGRVYQLGVNLDQYYMYNDSMPWDHFDGIPQWAKDSFIECGAVMLPVPQASIDWAALVVGEVVPEFAPVVDLIAGIARAQSIPELLIYIRTFLCGMGDYEDKISLLGALAYLKSEFEELLAMLLSVTVVDVSKGFVYDMAKSAQENFEIQRAYAYAAICQALSLSSQGPEDEKSSRFGSIDPWVILQHPAIVNTPLFRAFYDLVSHVSVSLPLRALGILDMEGWKDLVSKHQAYIVCDPNTFVTKCLTFVKMVFENVYTAITKRDISLLWGSYNYQLWLTRAMELYEDGATDKEVKLGVFMPYTAFERIEHISEHIKSGEALLAKLTSWKTEPVITSSVSNMLFKLRQKAESERVMAQGGKLRMTPFAFILLGEPGIGKTTMVPTIFNALFSSVQFQTGMDQVYCLKPGQKHWSGFRNQPGIWFDDVDKSPVTPTGDFQGHAVEVVNVVNPQPYMSPQADLSDKGKYFARPVAVAYTTNHETCNIKGKITDAGPFWRRFALRVIVHLKESYMHDPKSNRTLDPAKLAEVAKPDPYVYEIQRYAVPPDPNSFEVAHMKTVGCLETEAEFYAFMIQSFKKHYEKEQRVLGAMTNVEFCPKCSIPLRVHGDECMNLLVVPKKESSYTLTRNTVETSGVVMKVKGKLVVQGYEWSPVPPWWSTALVWGGSALCGFMNFHPRRKVRWSFRMLSGCGVVALLLVQVAKRPSVRCVAWGDDWSKPPSPHRWVQSLIGGISSLLGVLSFNSNKRVKWIARTALAGVWGFSFYLEMRYGMTLFYHFRLRNWSHWSHAYYGQRVVTVGFQSGVLSWMGWFSASAAAFLGSSAYFGWFVVRPRLRAFTQVMVRKARGEINHGIARMRLEMDNAMQAGSIQAIQLVEARLWEHLVKLAPKIGLLVSSLGAAIVAYRMFTGPKPVCQTETDLPMNPAHLNKGIRSIYAQKRRGDYDREWVPEPKVLGEASTTTTYDQLRGLVKRNLVTLSSQPDPASGKYTLGVRLTGNIFLFPGHYFLGDVLGYYSFGDEERTHEHGRVELRQGVEIFLHPNKDLAVVHISGIHPGGEGVLKHISVSSQLALSGQIDAGMLLVRKYKGSPLELDLPKVEMTVAKDVSKRQLPTATAHWTYPVKTEHGWCGGVLMLRRSQSVWIGGIHTMGYDNNVGGFSTEVTQLDLMPLVEMCYKQTMTAMPSMPVPVTQGVQGEYVLEPEVWQNNPFQGAVDVNAALVGSLEKVLGSRPHASKLQTGVRPTPYADLFDDIRQEELGNDRYVGPIGKGMEIDGKWCEPFDAALKACAGVTDPLMSELDLCCDDYVTGVDSLPGLGTFKVLSDSETLYGIPGSSIRAFDRTTSAGYPFFRNKSSLVSPDPSIGMSDTFRKQLEWANGELAAGRLISPIVSWTLKDEPLLESKVRGSNKARVFMCFPFVFNFLVKKYLGPVMSFIFMHRQFFECYAGMNICSKECHTFVLHLMRFANCIDGDAEKYDKRFPHTLRCAVNQVLMHVAIKLGYSVQEQRIVNLLLVSSIYHFAYLRGALMAWAFTVPSGELLTVVLDSIGMSLMMRLAFRRLYQVPFRSRVALGTLGDDNLQSVASSCPDYHFAHIRKVFGEFGMFFTPADKQDKPDYHYKAITDCSFLKRRFVLSAELGGWIPPLDKKSLVKTLTVYIPGKTSEKDQFAGALDSVLRESFLHGREFFERIRGKVLVAVERHGISYTVPTYDLLKKSFFEEKFATWVLDQ